MVVPAWTTLEQAVERSKSEILADMLRGQVPSTCRSYSELHDYVDANEYGGACDEDSVLGPGEMEFWSAVQEAVDQWLRNDLR